MAVQTNAQEATVEIKEQERFKSDKLFSLLIILILLGAQCLAIVQLIFMLRSTVNPAPVFFPATSAGQLLLEPPLDKPNAPNNVILNWVTEGLMALNSFNFMTYQTVMDKGRSYFTIEGYQFYQKALTDSKIIEKVVNQKLVLTATATDAPQITKEGALGGRYLWKVRIPMNFRYQAVEYNNFENVEITILVMRVPTLQSPTGLVILKYDMEFKNI